jgi:hypothetical protein
MASLIVGVGMALPKQERRESRLASSHSGSKKRPFSFLSPVMRTAALMARQSQLESTRTRCETAKTAEFRGEMRSRRPSHRPRRTGPLVPSLRNETHRRDH